MTEPGAPPEARRAAATDDNPSPDERRDQLRAAGAYLVGLLVLGALLGLVWDAWSPPGPLGGVFRAGVVPDETESWAAGDGRYALIGLVVGLAAGISAWFVTRGRGPWMALALGVGGVAGAALTDLVGWATRGQGTDYACGTDTGRCVHHLPLTVHMHGLWFAEGVVAVLVYCLFVAFARDDDLGRPDFSRDAARFASGRRRGAVPQPGPADEGSVPAQRGAQHRGSHGDGAGLPHQGDLPPH